MDPEMGKILPEKNNKGGEGSGQYGSVGKHGTQVLPQPYQNHN